MDQFLKKNLSIISFILIPILFLWHPNWLGIMGTQPYWPLFWLLPWSMIYGSINGLIVGLFLGIILDSLSIGGGFTQIPGLILCGIWFGRFRTSENILVAHLRYGLICAIGSFLCGSFYYFQFLIQDFPDNQFLLFIPSVKNVLAQVFLTGLFAPFLCSQLFRLFKRSK